jgi:hypothetical protein
VSNYGIKIVKAGFDTATAVPKDQIFNSSLACLKILQIGKQSAVDASEITFIAVVAFPIVLLVFLYDSATSRYKPIEAEFDSTKIYLPGGEAANSYYYYFVCYA